MAILVMSMLRKRIPARNQMQKERGVIVGLEDMIVKG